nr:unnamed protein product [Callosobruchus analis]
MHGHFNLYRMSNCKTKVNACMSAEHQLLPTLSYYSNGSFLRVSGDFALHQRPKTREKFYQIARFPRCIAAISSIHVEVQSSGGEQQSFSETEKLISIEPYLTTSLLQTDTEGKRLFNKTINTVERAYGVRKIRFPALAVGIRLNLYVTLCAIVASAVRHDTTCDERDSVPPVSDIEEEAIVQSNNMFDGELPAIGATRELNETQQKSDFKHMFFFFEMENVSPVGIVTGHRKICEEVRNRIKTLTRKTTKAQNKRRSRKEQRAAKKGTSEIFTSMLDGKKWSEYTSSLRERLKEKSSDTSDNLRSENVMKRSDGR